MGVFYFCCHPRSNNKVIKVIDLDYAVSYEKNDWDVVDPHEFTDRDEAIKHARRLADVYGLEYRMFESRYGDDKNEYLGEFEPISSEISHKRECLTPGAAFHTEIGWNFVKVKVDFPGSLVLSKNPRVDESEAKHLEQEIHDAIEAVLARRWHLIHKDYHPGDNHTDPKYGREWPRD